MLMDVCVYVCARTRVFALGHFQHMRGSRVMCVMFYISNMCSQFAVSHSISIRLVVRARINLCVCRSLIPAAKCVRLVKVSSQSCM